MVVDRAISYRRRLGVAVLAWSRMRPGVTGGDPPTAKLVLLSTAAGGSGDRGGGGAASITGDASSTWGQPCRFRQRARAAPASSGAGPFSQRVLLTLEEKKVPYEMKLVDLGNKPKWYVPFWTCTTLIFVAASIATFVTYLSHKWHKKEWNYDVNLVIWSAGLVYGYVTFVPLLLYVILKYFSAPAGLVQLWCLYGYSLFIFIPASMCRKVNKEQKKRMVVVTWMRSLLG